MKEQKNNGRGVFYGVIGVATLVVAIIGATFAYFTATASNNNTITGNMATITFDLAVKKVTTADQAKGGMIPMSNSMVESAVGGTKTDNAKYQAGDPEVTAGTKNDGEYKDPQICVDDNGNAVCQIYKISVVNGGSAGMFLDGYVSLTGGSGVPTDITPTSDLSNLGDDDNATTMRWAQVFCTGEDDHLTSCTTAGTTTARLDSGVTGSGFTTNWTAISKAETVSNETSGKNVEQIVKTGETVTGTAAISGNNYDVINKNYIRVSDHDSSVSNYYRTTDVTSALVFNQFISAKNTTTSIGTTDDSNGIGGTTAYTDAQVYYIVVWLGENGKNQTAGSTEDNVPAIGSNFFQGKVAFVSAQGSEVTATFSGYTSVESDTKNQS